MVLPTIQCDNKLWALSMKPRFRYDCVFCKFNWNCGPVCACIIDRYEDLTDIPKEVRIYVNNVRKRHGYNKEFPAD